MLYHARTSRKAANRQETPTKHANVCPTGRRATRAHAITTRREYDTGRAYEEAIGTHARAQGDAAAAVDEERPAVCCSPLRTAAIPWLPGSAFHGRGEVIRGVRAFLPLLQL